MVVTLAVTHMVSNDASCSKPKCADILKMSINAKDSIDSIKGLLEAQTGHRVLRLKYRGNAVTAGDIWDFIPEMEDDAPRFVAYTCLPLLQQVVTFTVWSPAGQPILISEPRSTSIQTIKQGLKDKTGIPVHRQHLIYAGSLLENDKTLHDYGDMNHATIGLSSRRQTGCLSNLLIPPRRSPRLTTIPFDQQSISIQVRTLIGKTLFMNATRAMTTAVLKERIQDIEGIPPDQQRLIVQGKQMEDDKPLAHYEVENGTVFHLVLRLRGGGSSFMFADMTNNSARKVVPWGKGPDWRIAPPGLNVEGYCPHFDCEAWDQLVICPVGMASYIAGTKRPCPSCHGDVIPITSAFTDCSWRFDGRRTDGLEVKSAWNHTGHQYERFDPKESMVSWDRLVITAKPLDASTQECPICYEDVRGSDVTVNQCGHKAHQSCMEMWRKFGSTCPMCRRAL